jgi:hypothetical protein
MTAQGAEGRKNQTATAEEKKTASNVNSDAGSTGSQHSLALGLGNGAGRDIGARNQEEGGIFNWLEKKYSELKRFGLFYPEELKSPTIIAGMLAMWRDSLPHDSVRRHEEGAFWGTEQDGSYGLRRWDSTHATRDNINPPDLPANMIYQGLRVLGEAHVHPSPLVDEYGVVWNLAPSRSDFIGIKAARYSRDSYVIDREGLMRVSPWGDWDVKNRTFVSFKDAFGEDP